MTVYVSLRGSRFPVPRPVWKSCVVAAEEEAKNSRKKDNPTTNFVDLNQLVVDDSPEDKSGRNTDLNQLVVDDSPEDKSGRNKFADLNQLVVDDSPEDKSGRNKGADLNQLPWVTVRKTSRTQVGTV